MLKVYQFIGDERVDFTIISLSCSIIFTSLSLRLGCNLECMACHTLIGSISLSVVQKLTVKLPVTSILDSVQCDYLLSWSFLFRKD